MTTLPRGARYSTIAIGRHWTIAASVVASLAVGLLHATPLDGVGWAIPLHKSFGMTVFALTAARIVWRLTHRSPAANSVGDRPRSLARLFPLRVLPLALLLAAAAPPVPTAERAHDTFAALRAVDLRMARIAYRLTTANVALCRDVAPTPGWAIHGLGQYDPALREAARAVFGFAAPVAVEAVVPGAPAAVAGVRENDAIVAIDGVPLAAAAPGKSASSADRDAATARIAALPADRPFTVDLVRDGVARTVVIPASPGCRSTFEVLLGPRMTASADGTTVQVGVRFFERYTDEEVAVVVGHELAHDILHHRDRLDAARVSRGLLAEVGRNGRLFRRTEDDADLLGLHLIRNAGYDPHAAVRFWREHGGDVDGGLLRSRTHASAKARAAALDAEIARIPADAPIPYFPPVLGTRDQPLQ